MYVEYCHKHTSLEIVESCVCIVSDIATDNIEFNFQSLSTWPHSAVRDKVGVRSGILRSLCITCIIPQQAVLNITLYLANSEICKFYCNLLFFSENVKE